MRIPRIIGLVDAAVKFFEIMEKYFVTNLLERPFNLEEDPMAKIGININTTDTSSDTVVENIYPNFLNCASQIRFFDKFYQSFHNHRRILWVL